MRKNSRRIDFNLNAALKGALRSLNLDARMRGYAAWGIWDKLVGETVAQQAQPSFLRRGILFIKCSSPAWMQQLQFMKGMILEKLNGQLGGEVIKDIRFQIGVVSRPSSEERPALNQGDVSDELEKEWMTEALRPLQDPEVREIVRRIMVRESSLKKKA